MSTSELFNDYLRQNVEVAESVDADELTGFLNGLRGLRDSGGTLWALGNGGSAATASHVAADFTKTSRSFNSKSLKCIALSEMMSLQTALANDLAFEQGFEFSLTSLAGKSDGVLFISVSGTSPNLLRAAEVANNLGLVTFAITGSKGSRLCSSVSHSICLPSEDYQVVENLHIILIHWFTIALGNPLA